MKILMSGSSGFVGSALQQFLKRDGHSITRLVRHEHEKEAATILWDPERGQIETSALEGFDAVVHLAGENIAGGRWNEERKQRILDSRVQGTRTLGQALSKLKNPPQVFVSTSAVGYYGNRGDTFCTEDTSNGAGFLAEVCRQWEAATEPAKQAGIRTAIMRFGVVLSPNDGALAKMLPVFKLGLGGVFGSGDQYISWISIDDLLAIILFTINNVFIEGPINVVSPHPITNREFTKTLGKVLNRPTILPVPAFALKLVLGSEMAEEMLLSSTRTDPFRLHQAGYQFLYPNLEKTLRHLLGL